MPNPLRGHGFSQGQHVCSLYANPDEQQDVAVAYVADGLRRNERCLYVAADPAALDQFRARMSKAGVGLAAAESTGALLLKTHGDAHLYGGRFDTERMLGMLNSAVEDALDAGFDGLRTCGDMSWLLDYPDASEQVVEYEALLNQFFLQTRALGMCQYDVRRLPPGLLHHAAIDTHCSVVIDGRHKPNPFYGVSAAASHASGVYATVTQLRDE